MIRAIRNFIVDKYRRLSAPVKASFWFTVSSVLTKGISFITLPIFSRILTTEEYGKTAVYSSWSSIFTIFCTLTIWGGVFNVAIVKNSEKVDSVVSSFQGMATTITLAFMAVFLLTLETTSNLLGMSALLTMCMFLEILVQTPFALWSSVERYFYRYRALVAISFSMAILNPIFAFVAIKQTPAYRAEARIITALILHIILGIYTFIYNQRKGRAFFNAEYWKFGFLFNIVLVPHYLSLQVLSQSDRLMINDICSGSEAGIYSVAYNFATLLSLFTAAIGSSFTPWLYKNVRNRNYETVSRVSNVVVTVVAALSLAMICVIPDVFRLMLPEAYYPAVWCIPPVTMSVFFMFLYPLFGAIEFYYEENKYITMASIIGAVINIILNYIFIRIFGYIAAAYTTLTCYILFSLAHYYFMKKVLRENKLDIRLYDTKTILLLSAVVLALMVVITVLYNSTPLRWLFILLITLVTFTQKNRLKYAASVLFIK